MIIGQDIIAQRFIEYANNDEFLVFSMELNEDHEEEVRLVSEAIKVHHDKIFVYFSSVSLFNSDEADLEYKKNKRKIEELVKTQASRFLVIRVSEVIGAFDEKSFLKFLVSAVKQDLKFDLWKNTYKNILDVDDLYFMTDFILQNKICINSIINIANPTNISIEDIVKKIETFLQKKANYEEVPKGTNFAIDMAIAQTVIATLGLRFDFNYVDRILKKYYRQEKLTLKKISIVVPTYFEEHGIYEFYKRTKHVLESLRSRYLYEMIFVNDGSTDRTLEILIDIAKSDKTVKILDFARNFGNQFAITAGIDRANGDAVVIIDDDLQDPPEVILSMIAKWEHGYEIVYGVRRKRKGVNPIFAILAKFYYRLIDNISEVKIPVDTGDFRLIDVRALTHLKKMREENRYYRGMVSWIGFKQFPLLYNRDARYAGTSTFTLKKYFKFAFDGVSSFSEKPLYFSALFGVLITTGSLFFAFYLILSKILDPSVTIRGWTSLVIIAIFFGGVQLLFTGVIGLYVGKIYREVKGRPLYIIKNEFGFESYENNKKSGE